MAPRLKSLSPLALALLAALALVAGCASDSGGPLAGGRLGLIQQRGRLICGINGQLPGFSSVGADGRFEGLDVEICRALAAAVLGDPAKLDLKLLSSNDRFAAVASGDVDLLSRNTTLNLSRDAPGGNALSFAPIVYYDGGGVLAPVSSGITRLADLAERTVCVVSGSTNEGVLADRMGSLGLTYVPIRYRNADETFAAYLSGRCAAVTSDRSGLAARRTLFPDPAAHRLLPGILSKEPMAPASGQADPVWADAVRWSVRALIEAEELGLSRANLAARTASARADPRQSRLRRFLGLEGDLGRQLGLPADFAARAIAAVGNYGELFERTLGKGSPLGLERGPNRLWRDGGLLVSPPFR
jgi:general L-amino acid transport system substrate-binding protein